MSKLLVADIGGTKTDYAIVDVDDSAFAPVAQGTLENKEYTSCEDVVAACLDGFDGQIDFLSLAVAGPVTRQQVSFTNLPWKAASTALKERFGFRDVLLVNDLVAFAEGVNLLESRDVEVVKPGVNKAKASKLVVAPGTGLGAAFCLGEDQGATIQATEAGHLSFTPRNEVEIQLHRFLHDKHGHVSFEMICSGTGLGNIFSFLKEKGVVISGELEAQLGNSLPLGPLLSSLALDEKVDCPISTKTFEIFFDTLAEFCGNLSVTVLPEGGIYLGGGMLQFLAPLLNTERFIDRFTSRGQMSSLVESFSINLISYPHTPLLGAYTAAQRTFLI